MSTEAGKEGEVRKVEKFVDMGDLNLLYHKYVKEEDESRYKDWRAASTLALITTIIVLAGVALVESVIMAQIFRGNTKDIVGLALALLGVEISAMLSASNDQKYASFLEITAIERHDTVLNWLEKRKKNIQRRYLNSWAVAYGIATAMMVFGAATTSYMKNIWVLLGLLIHSTIVILVTLKVIGKMREKAEKNVNRRWYFR
jgi:hypothetical protein